MDRCPKKAVRMVCFISDWRESVFVCEAHASDIVTEETEKGREVRSFGIPKDFHLENLDCGITKYTPLEREGKDDWY